LRNKAVMALAALNTSQKIPVTNLGELWLISPILLCMFVPFKFIAMPALVSKANLGRLTSIQRLPFSSRRDSHLRA
jgi:hypothetical protein